MQIELNNQFKEALNLIENTNHNVFITGKAGTGKSTLLRYFKEVTKKKVVVLAPTGIAAINIGGQTVHSFFRFKPDITYDKIKKLDSNKIKIYEKLDTIVIDEISMLRADLLDYIDFFLRKNLNSNEPFAGKQMVFIGDLYQLPPVVTSDEEKIFSDRYKSQYFFDSDAFKQLSIKFIELETVYRQKDEVFLNILNKIRNNSIEDDDLEILNKRVLKPKNEDYLVYLTTINKKAKEINDEKLKALNKKILEFDYDVSGEFEREYFPADTVLFLSEDAQVMFLNNDLHGRWVNGTVGKVIGFEVDEDGNDIVVVEKEDGDIVEVKKHTWEIFKYIYNEDNKKIETKTIGSFSQIPLKLSWAVTIHKSQGKTFEKIFIDLSRSMFAHGQLYVALSRARSLSGIFLSQRVKKHHIIMDRKIVNFLTSYKYKISEDNMPFESKKHIIEQAIKNNEELDIVYLKPNNEKSKRKIKPLRFEQIEYANKKIDGFIAYCYKKNDERFFKIERILEIKKI